MVRQYRAIAVKSASPHVMIGGLIDAYYDRGRLCIRMLSYIVCMQPASVSFCEGSRSSGTPTGHKRDTQIRRWPRKGFSWKTLCQPAVNRDEKG